MTRPAPIAVRLDADSLAKLDAYAAEHGLTRNAAIVAFVRAGVEQAPVMVKVKPDPAPTIEPSKAERLQPVETGKAQPSNVEQKAPVRNKVERQLERAESHATALQLGPVRPAPGSLLKGGKR